MRLYRVAERSQPRSTVILNAKAVSWIYVYMRKGRAISDGFCLRRKSRANTNNKYECREKEQ